MSDENNDGPLFLYSVGPLPTGINHHWKPRVRRHADGRRYIQIDLSDVGMSYRSQVQEATRAYLTAHRTTQARLDYAYCNGDGLGVVATLHFPDQRSDLDGPLKLALDALVDGLDLDDDQIRLLVVIRATDPVDPRLELRVGTLADTTRLAIHQLKQIAGCDLPIADSTKSVSPHSKLKTQSSKLHPQFAIRNSQFKITLPDPPSFNKAWQWRIERGESGRLRPVAYLSPAYTKYKAAAKVGVLHMVQSMGKEAATELAQALAAAGCKGGIGLGLVVTLHKQNGDTDNYVKPTIDALIEALNAAAATDPALVPLGKLNDRYITLLVALKGEPTSPPSAEITLAALPFAAQAGVKVLMNDEF